jgi:hypothetical protein
VAVAGFTSAASRVVTESSWVDMMIPISRMVSQASRERCAVKTPGWWRVLSEETVR